MQLSTNQSSYYVKAHCAGGAPGRGPASIRLLLHLRKVAIHCPSSPSHNIESHNK